MLAFLKEIHIGNERKRAARLFQVLHTISAITHFITFPESFTFSSTKIPAKVLPV
jgi:hypothetical protein